MEYFYRIYFNNGEKDDFTGRELIGKKLSAFDKFSITPEFKIYLEKGCQCKGMPVGEIKSVKIVCKRDKGDPIEYNTIGANPYFSDIFNYIKEEQVWEYGRYQAIREVISTESNAYQEMRDYLFDQLRNNSKQFLEEIYKSDSEFHDLLRKYAASYSSNTNEEEEYHNTYELETAIRSQLTRYQTYRSLATKRFYFEKYAPYESKQKPKQKPIQLTKEEKEYRDKMLEEYYARKDTVTQRTNEYNQEHEEFIEPDEYGQMNGYTGERIK